METPHKIHCPLLKRTIKDVLVCFMTRNSWYSTPEFPDRILNIHNKSRSSISIHSWRLIARYIFSIVETENGLPDYQKNTDLVDGILSINIWDAGPDFQCELKLKCTSLFS